MEEKRPKPPKSRPLVSAILDDGQMIEMVRPQESRTAFAVSSASGWTIEDDVTLPSGEHCVPYRPQNNLLRHEVVLLPSEPQAYEAESALLDEIRSFIHRYVDLPPRFEEIASYYVLFTWIYDAFNEVPYLRVRGDYGSGKSRFLLTVGSLCYKPIFASGASTVSPIFRILDTFRGTLILDEGDFRASDEKAEIVKILNNGNARGFPVLRSEQTPQKEFDPRAYAVFGPKIIATRGVFEDRALESRCLSESMGQARLRTDIPLNIPPAHKAEAQTLRNKLLAFRFRNFAQERPLGEFEDRSIEPRLAQIFAPLLRTIHDPEARGRLQALARQYDRDLRSDRGLDLEAQVLDVIHDLSAATEGPLSLQEIAGLFLDRYGQDYDRKITPKWIGGILRRRLTLSPQKSHGVFVLPVSEYPKLIRLYEKYGIGETTPAGDRVDEGDMGDIPKGGTNEKTASIPRGDSSTEYAPDVPHVPELHPERVVHRIVP